MAPTGNASESSATVVVFPAAKIGRDGDWRMERINQFEFFELGERLQELKTLTIMSEVAPSDALFPFWRAHTAVGELVAGKPLELSVSKACATRLRDALWNFLEAHCRQDGPDGKRVWKFSGPDAPKIPGWGLHEATTALSDFETIFREEMREAAVYRVPRRGIFDTAMLVDDADRAFPAEIAMLIPRKTREDWKAAGRCLAFNLLSASGFHVARAVEGTIEAYYQAACGIPSDSKRATLHSWGDYIKALEAARTAEPPKGKLIPSEKVLSEILQMKDDYRNPIAHPRIVLSEADARMLFANGESLIIAMAQELKSVMPSPAASAQFGFGTPSLSEAQ